MISLLLFIGSILTNYSYLYYIGSSDALPPPLSKEEEEGYLLRSEDGDSFAKDKLIEHNLRLVVFLAKKYENTGVDLEDLVSIGTIGLIKGINTFHRDKNIKLATYASKGVETEDDKKLMINEVLRLEPRDRDIMILRYGLLGQEEKTQKEVADMLGISQSYISRIEKKVIKRLRSLVHYS